MFRSEHVQRGGLSGTLIVLCCTLPAMAEMCTFTTECFEDSACSKTMFEMEIVDSTLVSDAETVPVTRSGSDETAVYSGLTGSAFHVLTQEAENTARYTTHIFGGPLVVSYMGECR